MNEIEKICEILLARAPKMDNPREILKSPELKELYKTLPELPESERPKFGRKINELQKELKEL